MSEVEKAGQQQALQEEKSGLLEEPLRGPCETLEAATSRLSEAMEVEKKGSKQGNSQ
jgi:hypothetical protein